MLKATYRILLVLIVFAVIGGPVLHFAQPETASMAPMVMAKMPCDMAMSMTDAGPGPGAPFAPCKGLTSECVKQMGCVANAALPTRIVNDDVTFAFSLVSYWSTGSEMTGMAQKLEPFPPRTA